MEKERKSKTTRHRKRVTANDCCEKFMKPEELRIGNWVRHYSSWSYRQPDKGPMEEFDFQWDDSDWYAMGECTMEIDKIKPIALTMDWLLKFGFVTDDITYWLYDYSEIQIGAFKGNVFIPLYEGSLNRDLCAPVVYVHQLQNLYYALTGKELIVK